MSSLNCETSGRTDLITMSPRHSSPHSFFILFHQNDIIITSEINVISKKLHKLNVVQNMHKRVSIDIIIENNFLWFNKDKILRSAEDTITRNCSLNSRKRYLEEYEKSIKKLILKKFQIKIPVLRNIVE